MDAMHLLHRAVVNEHGGPFTSAARPFTPTRARCGSSCWSSTTTANRSPASSAELPVSRVGRSFSPCMTGAQPARAACRGLSRCESACAQLLPTVPGSLTAGSIRHDWVWVPSVQPTGRCTVPVLQGLAWSAEGLDIAAGRYPLAVERHVMRMADLLVPGVTTVTPHAVDDAPADGTYVRGRPAACRRRSGRGCEPTRL